MKIFNHTCWYCGWRSKDVTFIVGDEHYQCTEREPCQERRYEKHPLERPGPTSAASDWTSVSLLLCDALRFTDPELIVRSPKVLLHAARLLNRELVTTEMESSLFQEMLDAHWQTIAPYTGGAR